MRKCVSRGIRLSKLAGDKGSNAAGRRAHIRGFALEQRHSLSAIGVAAAHAMASLTPLPCPCSSLAPSMRKTHRTSVLTSTSCLPDRVICKTGFKTRSRTAPEQNRRVGGRFTVRALELDQDTLVAISVGVAGLAVGIGIPIFYETQVKGSAERENDQPCFPCKGTGSQVCRFCVGAGNITVELGGGEREVSKCINCEGSGSLTCTTCQGTGVQPRYLDRREYKDDD